MMNFNQISRRDVMKLAAGGVAAGSLLRSSIAWAQESTVIIGGIAEDASLDPNNTSATDWLGLLLNIYETAVARDMSGAIVPGLATEWNQIDETNWELTTRENVKFQDGQAFSAEDVVYSYKRVLDPENRSPQRSYLSAIDTLETSGPNTVRVKLTQPDPLFLQYLLLIPIVKTGATKESLARAANGTGPYKLERWTPGDQLSIVAAEEYWGDKPQVQRAVFRSFPEANSLVAAFQAGEVHIAVNLQPDIAMALGESDMYAVVPTDTERSVYIVLDNMVKPFDDQRVRRAINLAINRDAIVRDVMLGNATPIANQLGPMYLGYNPDLEPRYDPDEARRLLTEAGYPDGIEFKLNAPSGRYLKDREVSEAIVGQLAEAGIKVNLELQEFGTLMTRYRAHELSPAYLIGYSLPILDSGRALQSYFTPDFVQAYFRDPEIEASIKEAVQIQDEAEREAALKAINKKLFDVDAFVYLYLQKAIFGVSKQIEWTPRSDERIRIREIRMAG